MVAAADSVFAPILTLRSLSLLFNSDKSDLKVLFQQGSYSRLRGTGRIQSFCFTPLCTFCKSFSFLSAFLLLSIRTYSEEPGYSYVLVCILKAFVFICMNRLLFCQNFPPAFRFSFSLPLAEALFRFYYSA
jgi:hypothetical protein